MGIGIYLVAAALIAVFIFALIKRKSDTEKESQAQKGQVQEQQEFRDLNQDFLDKAGGRSSIQVVNTYNLNDLMILRSLLDAEGVCTWVDFENMQSLFPGVTISGYSDSCISVFREDKELSKEIISEYLINVQNNQAESSGKLRSIAEFAIGGYAIPNASTRLLPELLV